MMVMSGFIVLSFCGETLDTARRRSFLHTQMCGAIVRTVYQGRKSNFAD